MGSKSDYLEAKVLDHCLGAVTYTPPATVYFAVFTAAPSDSGGGTEATSGSYARKSITNNATNFPNASGTSPTLKSNGTAITMVTASAPWSSGADMTHWGLFDASTSGNLLYWGALTEAKPVGTGDTLTIPVGDLDITED